jgi:hypothetical protein
MIDETEIASKYVRFFNLQEESKYALFVETGPMRNITAKLSTDHSQIHLSITYPCPPDELVHKGGFKHAAKFALKETEEIFVFEAPFSKFQKQTVDYYPNKVTPLWLIFKYELEDDQEQTTVGLNLDLSNLYGLK